MQSKKNKSKYGKWIAGGLGWALGGPIGGILGFILGSIYDDMQSAAYEYKGPATAPGEPEHTRRGDFSVSLLILASAVMKADGKVMRSELQYVKDFLVRTFGEEEATQMLPILKTLLQREVPLRDVCQQIADNMEYSQRLQLLHFLYGIAAADQDVSQSEIRVIEQMGIYLGIYRTDLDTLKGLFVKDLHTAYTILGVNEDASEEEIKRAYRKLVFLHHPDRVAHLGEDIQRAANEKLRQINAAYEEIKRKRGFA
ncbi:MAG: TerB family tellurite resistance protein [Bacteroidales bacterium]